MESGFGLTQHTQYVPTFISTSLILTTYLKISAWVVAPYKKPERDLPENEVFNNHLSHIRIRSEHAIGYLKGRFQSLKELRVQIMNQKSHKFATYWVACCIGVHAFAMACEAADEDNDYDGQDFINDGLSSSSDSDAGVVLPRQQRPGRLGEGKALCEALKRRLFRAKARRQRQGR
jgi:DDE superfamily endonuclease